MTLLISQCLMGCNCRYDGKSNRLKQLSLLMEKYNLIPVCAEILGGLPTPRIPSERVENRVVNQLGEDVTMQFVRGAQEVLKIAKLYGCTAALLKERSPSCGFGQIYNGTFSGTLADGNGVTAQLLAENGIRIIGESQLALLL